MWELCWQRGQTDHNNSPGFTGCASSGGTCASHAPEYAQSLPPTRESIEEAALGWADPSRQPAQPLSLVRRGSFPGPYSVLFHPRSHDKQLSNVISSNWNDDINYSMAHSCYWPEPSPAVMSRPLVWVTGWEHRQEPPFPPPLHSHTHTHCSCRECWGMVWMGRLTTRERGRERERRGKKQNIFLVSDCRLHPAV